MAKKPLNLIDKHVGSRVRMRRMMLDMSQTKLGDALGREEASRRMGSIGLPAGPHFSCRFVCCRVYSGACC
jgi:hypothetical protein